MLWSKNSHLMRLKNRLESWLVRLPKIYGRLLILKNRRNWEKAVYLMEVKQGGIIFDIGANFGRFTVLFSTLVGRSGAVHSFEPVPSSFETLKREVGMRCLHANTILNRTAVADKQGRSKMLLPSGNSQEASLRALKTGAWQAEASVEEFDCVVTTVDDYVRAFRLEHVDFIKIDVEGAELQALRGAEATRRRHGPTVFFELSSERAAAFGYTPSEALQFLRSVGYTRFALVDDAFTPLASPAAEARLSQACLMTNVLCHVV